MRQRNFNLSCPISLQPYCDVKRSALQPPAPKHGPGADFFFCTHIHVLLFSIFFSILASLSSAAGSFLLHSFLAGRRAGCLVFEGTPVPNSLLLPAPNRRSLPLCEKYNTDSNKQIKMTLTLIKTIIPCDKKFKKIHLQFNITYRLLSGSSFQVPTIRLGISPTAPFHSSTANRLQRLQQTITAYFLSHCDTNNSVFKTQKLRTMSYEFLSRGPYTIHVLL